jgi:hypothetical protein
MIKAIRKVLTTLILTLLITPDHMEAEGDNRTPQVGINLVGINLNGPMRIG